MQLVEHQELQPLGGSNDCLVAWILPGEQVLQHHVISKEDVWWIVLDDVSDIVIVLACVSAKCHWWPFRKTKAEIFLKLFALAIAERVHRVDDDCSDALALVTRCAFPQHVIHDRNDVAQ